MKKIKKIKINFQLDYVQVEVDGVCHTRFEIANYLYDSSQSKREHAIHDAKAECFNVLWKLTEAGEKAEIVPYIN